VGKQERGEVGTQGEVVSHLVLLCAAIAAVPHGYSNSGVDMERRGPGWRGCGFWGWGAMCVLDTKLFRFQSSSSKHMSVGSHPRRNGLTYR